MNLKNTSTKYGFLHALLHLVMALLIITLLAVGVYMESTPYNPKIFFLHKSFGVLVLILAFTRIVWKAINTKVIQKSKMASLGHFVLYVFMMAMPLSGILGSYFKGYATNVFNIFIIPAGVKNVELSSFFFGMHGILALLLGLTIIGHVFMGLYHHFILKDDTLKRMSLKD